MAERRERDESDAGAPLALIATGALACTRERARKEMQQRETRRGQACTTPRRKSGVVAKYEPSSDVEDAYLLSPSHADEAVIQELRARPAVNFVVQNTRSEKEDEVLSAAQVRPQPPSSKSLTRLSHNKRQSWFSPVHVPLPHRKLVNSPRELGGLTPSAPDSLSAKGSQNQLSNHDSPPRKNLTVPRVALLHTASRDNDGGVRRRSVDRQFLDHLRSQNRELYDKLVSRFKASRRMQEVQETNADMAKPNKTDEDGMLQGVVNVEDAVLFFLHEKHKHDVLYFKRKTDAYHKDKQGSRGRISLSIASNAATKMDPSSRYMPYDLGRITSLPKPGSGDFFIMSSSALVHHSNTNEDEIVGESIPIAQWIMESKMFALLLAGIPLFQKFLMRKVFVWWAMEIRRVIFSDLRRRINRSLPLGRESFALPMLASFQALRRVRSLQALTLPQKHVNAVSLYSLQDHHRERLSETETKLIDAKEELLSLMDSMVHRVTLNTDPSTQLDDLYSAEASAIHLINPKWKSAPIKALRSREMSLTKQVETAELDLSLLDKYVRLMEYMFTESVYLMILGCVRHLTFELRSEESLGTISASVAIVGDELVLSPSANETKNVLLEGVARLIRLAGNFHFTKNAIAWSTNRGSGALTALATAFAPVESVSQFDLVEVLRQDPEFKIVSTQLIEEVSTCFNEAAHQMKAFESLKPIYAAVKSVSRTETLRNLQLSEIDLNREHVVEVPSVVGMTGGELSRYLRSVSHRLTVLDKSQHACQKIQSSWKVGFLEIQCRRSVTDIVELITQERESLHHHLARLAFDGINDCLGAVQKVSLVLEDRPQLIEFFCEQLKQVRLLKDREKQLHQDIRNVDEVVRALKRYAIEIFTANSSQYSLLHTVCAKYGMISQSHEKFVNKMLPNITQQVSSALQRCTVRCQKILRLYEENAGIATEEDLEKNVGTFQDITRELRSIEDATRLYHDYQKMVGMKVVEITMLAEAKNRWDEVQDIVSFIIQWRAATKVMESGIFSDQPWRAHLEKVSGFLGQIESMLLDHSRVFAVKLLERLKGTISDYHRRLEVVIDMAQPYVKAHHWQQVFALLDIVNYVSASGVVLLDGSTLTLGFLQTRSLWKFEGHIRDIIIRARHDAVTESKMEEMKKRIYSAVLPIVKLDDTYELETTGAIRLLSQFENDLLTVQTLAQITSSVQLSNSLAQWAGEISSYLEVLDCWAEVHGDWKRLASVFGHHDVQQIVVDATYEFQALDRKWRAMMVAAKGASSLAVCLREVMSRVFLNNCSATAERLWKELSSYLWEKRHFFPRLQFVSDRDLLHIIASSKYPNRLSQLISKCFREISSLRLVRVDTVRRQRHASSFVRARPIHDSTKETKQLPLDMSSNEMPSLQLFDIEGVVGISHTDDLTIKPLRVTSSPEIWMKDLNGRVQEAVKGSLCSTMDGPLASMYEEHFASLSKTTVNPALLSDSAEDIKTTSPVLPWMKVPMQALMLCLNVMLTNELSILVFVDRKGVEWSNFWDGFALKKKNLVSYIRRRDIDSRARQIATNIIVLLMNKTAQIEDLCRDESSVIPSSTLAALQHHHDSAAIHCNYANGSSFSWTRMIRFYYEPFEKRCVIHQSVKTYEFGNAFIGEYSVPVLTPLCDRAILALNLAMSLEVGAFVHSSRNQSAGKRTMVRELAASVGCEIIALDCSVMVGYSLLHRFVHGMLQSENCWVALGGLESRVDTDMVRIIGRELGRLRDAIHGCHDTFVLDGTPIIIANANIALFALSSLDLSSNTDHRELLLRLSHILMPVVCSPPNLSRIASVLFTASGMKDSNQLGERLDLLVEAVQKSPVPCLSASVTVRQFTAIIRNTAGRCVGSPWKSEEKCLVLSFWEEIGTSIIPEQRMNVIKLVRTAFPVAESLQLSPLGILATKANREDRGDGNVVGASGDDLAYDSDDEDRRLNLHKFREQVLNVLGSTRHFVVTDQYLRKLIDLYHVVSRNGLTVLVGHSGSGKTTALEALSAVFLGKISKQVPDGASDLPLTAVESQAKLLRLFSSVFTVQDIYGHFKEDKSWSEGFVYRFLRHNAEAGLASSIGDSSLSRFHDRRASLATLSEPSGYHRAGSHSPWLVLDGVTDPLVTDPLRDVAECDPLTRKILQLPNGDQLQCENPLLRIFCEVADLQDWTPGSVSRWGLLYFPVDLIPYTIILKSWCNLITQTKPKHAILASFMTKLSRSMLPSLLEVCKRHSRSFLEIPVTHLVSNYLRILSWFLDQMAPDTLPVTSSDGQRGEAEAKMVVIYAATMSLGLSIHHKGREEFHEAGAQLLPEDIRRDILDTAGRTIFDANLSFENERMVLSRFETPLPLLADGYSIWNRSVPRRRSHFRRVGDAVIRGGELAGLGTTSGLFVPTPRLLGYRRWMTIMLKAKQNVFVLGDSAIGKTRLLEDSVADMVKEERMEARCLQIKRSVRASDILTMIETGLSRKMRGLYCPNAGKKGLIVAIENLNLEAETSNAVRPCSEAIRQICDAKGSFVRSSREFTEFRDVSVACSFSLTPHGYPKLSPRLLRHFSIIWMTDETREVFRTVLATLPEQIFTRLPPTVQFQASDIARLCRFPIDMFHAIRKRLKPTPQSPHLLLSMNDVLRCLSRLMNVSIKSTETFRDLELYSLYSAYQLFRSRVIDAKELANLESIGVDTALKLGYSAPCLDVMKNPFEYMYADYGDSEGCVRITSRAAMALFVAADERFQWYHRNGARESIQVAEETNALSASAAQPMGMSPLPIIRKARTDAERISEPPMQDGKHDTAQITLGDTVSNIDDSSATNASRPGSTLLSPSRRHSQRHSLEKSTAASPATIQNMLDVLSFLQSGVSHLLLGGAESSKRRSATMVACGAQAFHFREITSQLKFGEYIDQLKVPIMEAGLKAAHTLVYADCDGLTQEEFDVLIHIMLHLDLPHHLYSSSDKAKILAQEHQLRSFQQTHLRRPSVSSFSADLTAVASTRDGIISLQDGPKDPSADSNPTSSLKKSVYIENLRRCLHIVLSFGRSTRMFDLVASYPTLYYNASVKTFRLFDRDSLEAVYTDCLGGIVPLTDALARATVASDARHDLQGLAVAIHEEGMHLLQGMSADRPTPDELGRRYGAAKSRFEDFLTGLRSLFLFQKAKLTERHDAFRAGLGLLERDSMEARDQLVQSADGHVHLLEAGRIVAESSAKLKEYDTIDRDSRRAFLLDEQRCSVLQSEIERERDLIQNELNKTLPDLTKATDALSQINKFHITEMKSFVNPPQLVRLVMQAVCVLLGAPPTWTEALRILADIHFLERLRHFEKDRVDASLIERVKMYINHPDFSMENMKRASIASTTLCKWVLAIVRYFEVMKRVAPTQRKLRETERHFREIEDMVRAERQKLIDLELQLNELREQHARNVQREQELQRSYENNTRWKTEVVQFQVVVNEWVRILRRRLARINDKHFKLIGDCTIVAATATYASAVPAEKRYEASIKWRELALAYLNGRQSKTSPPAPSISMPYVHSFLKDWFVGGKELREDFDLAVIGMEVRNEVPLTINMLLMDYAQLVCGKHPLLVDPLGRAATWLKHRCNTAGSQSTERHRDGVDEPSQQDVPGDSSTLAHSPARSGANVPHRFSILVVDACDPSAVAIMERCITHKFPLLILVEHVADSEESSFHALLDVASIAKKKGGHSVVFSTSSLSRMVLWKPKVWTQLGVVDCSPTNDEAEEHILSLFYKHHWPELETEYDGACREYVTEKSKQEQALLGFLDYLQTLGDEREAVNQSYTSTTKTRSERDNKASSEENRELHEHEMSRISRWLSEYRSVKAARQESKARAEHLRNTRRVAEAFPRRVLALLAVEKQFFTFLGVSSVGTLQWDSSSVIQHVEQCLRGHHPVCQGLVHKGAVDDARLQKSIQSVTDDVTHKFLLRRLLALPQNLHRTYRLLVALKIAEMKGEFDDEILPRIFTSGRLTNLLRIARKSSPSDRPTRPMGSTETLSLSRLVATKAVDTSIATALLRITGPSAKEPTATVPDALAGLYQKIELDFFSVLPQSHNISSLRQSLRHDMTRDSGGWTMFLCNPTLAVMNEDGTTVNSTSSPAPEWVSNLTAAQRFLLCIAVFESVSQGLIELVISQYAVPPAEHAVVSKLFVNMERELADGDVRPLVVHFNPRLQASAILSSFSSCARQAGVRDELVAVVSMRADTEACKLRVLKEIYAGGGWIVLHDLASSKPSTQNLLRIQLQALHELSVSAPTKSVLVNDFRLWILNPIDPPCTDDVCDRLGILPIHIYFEHPSNVRQLYQAFIEEEQARNSQLERQQQQQLLPTQASASASASSAHRRVSPSKRSVSGPSRTHLPPSSSLPDQLRTHAALWIFHALLRSHISFGPPDKAIIGGREWKAELGLTDIPSDVVASHYDLERATRVLQLHQRQRTLATSMSVVSGFGPGSYAESAAAEWACSYELASEIYAAKAVTSAAHLQLCRGLMSSCLIPTVLQQRSTEWHQQVAMLRDMIAQRLTSASSSAIREEPLMPHSLRRCCAMEENVAVLASLSRDHSRLDLQNGDSIRNLVLSAQIVVKQVMEQLPPKDALTIRVQHHEYQQRKSTITSRRRVPYGNAQSASSTTRFQWKKQCVSHLLKVELTAIERYMQCIWGLFEHLSALKADNVASLAGCSSNMLRDLSELLATLRRRELPEAWRLVDLVPTSMAISTASLPSAKSLREAAKYAAPGSLKKWTKWLNKAVAYFKGFAVTSQLPEPLWLPALGYPEACVFSILHGVATEHRVPYRSLSMLVIAAQETTSQNPGEPPTGASSDIFASFRVAGLFLWNAIWSSEKHALRESTTTPYSDTTQIAVLEPLPCLNVVVTSRFPVESPRPPADVTTHPQLYRCPVFRSAESKARLEDPLFYMLTPSVDRADVLAASGTAMFIQGDLAGVAMAL